MPGSDHRAPAAKWKALPLLLLIAFATSMTTAKTEPARTLYQLKRTVWDTEDGAPPSITTLTQSADGFLWIGSQEGLFRFDGQKFESMRSQERDKRSDDIVELYSSPRGDVFVGHNWGGVSVVRHGIWQSSGPNAPTGPVTSITGDRYGQVWASTTDQQSTRIRKWDGHRWGRPGEDIRAPAGLGAMLAASDGSLWLAVNERLYELPQGSRVPRLLPGTVGFGVGLAEDREGRIWVADAAGLRIVDAVRGVAVDARCKLPDGFGSPKLLFGRDGDLWAIGETFGILKVNPDSRGCTSEHFERRAAAGESARAIAQDREGNVWLGTGNGIEQYRVGNVLPIALPPAAAINRDSNRGPDPHVILDSRGNPLVAVLDSLFRLSADDLPAKRPMSLVRYSGPCPALGGGAWVRDRVDRLILVGGYVSRPPITLPVAWHRDDFGFRCLQDAKGRVWASVGKRGFFRYDGTVWRHFALDSAWPTGGAFTSASDADGVVYAYAGRSNLVRIEGDRTRIIWSEAALEHDFVDIIQPVTFGVLIGAENGLALWRNDCIRRLSASRFPVLRDISGIVERPDGNVWMIGKAGIVRVRTTDLLAAMEDPRRGLDFALLDSRDGLRGAPAVFGYSNLVGTPAGRLWATTDLGLFSVDPDTLSVNAVPPKVLIQTIAAPGFRATADDEVALPKGTSRLQIDYTATSLAIPSRVRFRYRMEGVDETWIDAGSRRQAFYNSLRPGNYRFRVTAANEDGVWSREGASLGISIPRSFYQTRWFYLLCGLMLVTVAWVAYSWRIRFVARTARDQVRARLGERERIARELHDTLLQGMQGLIMRAHAAVQLPSVQAPARSLLATVLDDADELVVESRDRVRGLRNGDDGQSASERIADVAKRVLGDDGPLMNLTVSGRERNLTGTALDELLMIERQALANVVQHACASTVSIGLSYSRRAFVLTIRDDGVGIDRDTLERGGRRNHYGITGMRERAARIGSSFDISAGIRGGTEVRVHVPASNVYHRTKPPH